MQRSSQGCEASESYSRFRSGSRSDDDGCVRTGGTTRGPVGGFRTRLDGAVADAGALVAGVEVTDAGTAGKATEALAAGAPVNAEVEATEVVGGVLAAGAAAGRPGNF